MPEKEKITNFKIIFAGVALEYDEGEKYTHFIDFYRDVLPEFRKCGEVMQFKVSCNQEPHLRGNVYVQFRR